MLLHMFYSLGKVTRACPFAHLLPHHHLKLFQFYCPWLFLFIPCQCTSLRKLSSSCFQHVNIYCTDTIIAHLSEPRVGVSDIKTM